MSIDQSNSPPTIGTVISRVERDDREARLWATGDLDMATGPGLTAAVLAEADDVDRITLDLGDVSFVDSSGVSAIVSCRSQLRARHVRLVVDNARTPVRRVFEITGLDDLLAG